MSLYPDVSDNGMFRQHTLLQDFWKELVRTHRTGHKSGELSGRGNWSLK